MLEDTVQSVTDEMVLVVIRSSIDAIWRRYALVSTSLVLFRTL
jgi:hypothetical protein